MKSMKDNKNSGNAKMPKKKGKMTLVIILLTLLIVLLLSVFRGEILNMPAKIKDAMIASGSGGKQADNENAGTSDATLKIQNNLAAKFIELEMRDSDFSIQYFPKDSAIEIKANIPRGRPVEWIVFKLLEAVKNTPYTIDDSYCASPRPNCRITLKSFDPKHPKIILRLQQAGRCLSNTAQMAILIENFGFEANQTTVEYLSFPDPLTISLIPAQKLAAWTAQIADEYKKEIVLSLPMEPLPQQFGQYKQTMITIHMAEEAIRSAIAQAAIAIPNFSGIANFHGSKAMEDTRIMEIIIAETNKRKAYFIYSDNSRNSVVPQLVKSAKIQNFPIQGTIELSHTVDQARDRLRRYAMTAEKNGKVLIKAPPTPAFMQALKEESEMLRSNCIRLVYVSELMK